MYRNFKLLFQAIVLHELRPWHAADDSRHSARAGQCGVGFGELQGAGCQVDLCTSTCHRVDVEVVLLTLQIQPEGGRGRNESNTEIIRCFCFYELINTF